MLHSISSWTHFLQFCPLKVSWVLLNCPRWPLSSLYSLARSLALSLSLSLSLPPFSCYTFQNRPISDRTALTFCIVVSKKGYRPSCLYSTLPWRTLLLHFNLSPSPPHPPLLTLFNPIGHVLQLVTRPHTHTQTHTNTHTNTHPHTHIQAILASVVGLRIFGRKHTGCDCIAASFDRV